MVTGQLAQSYHGIFIDPAESSGLSDAASFGKVLEDIDDLVMGESGVEQGRAGAFAESGFAGATGEHATGLLGSVSEGDAEVAGIALPMIGALGILTTEAAKVFHGNLLQQRGLAISPSHHTKPPRP